jgi:hypothetical protein
VTHFARVVAAAPAQYAWSTPKWRKDWGWEISTLKFTTWDLDNGEWQQYHATSPGERRKMTDLNHVGSGQSHATSPGERWKMADVNHMGREWTMGSAQHSDITSPGERGKMADVNPVGPEQWGVTTIHEVQMKNYDMRQHIKTWYLDVGQRRFTTIFCNLTRWMIKEAIMGQRRIWTQNRGQGVTLICQYCAT